MIETVLNVTAVQTIEYEVFGRVMERRGNQGHGPGVQDVYRCAGEDDWIAVTVRTEPEYAALADVTGGAALATWLASQDAEAAAERLMAAGVPAAVVVSPSLVTANPQLRHRGFFERLDHSSTGENLYPCPPFARLAGKPWLRHPPPTLGQHNVEVLTAACGLAEADLERLAAQGVIGTRPKGL